MNGASIAGRLTPLLAALAGLALAGCGSTTSSGEDSGTGPDTDLTISVKVDDESDANVMTLTCDPVGGDHPNPEAACDKLQGAGTAIFDPVAADQVCTMIYGGPQTATIKGVLDGEKVHGSFSRQNGCEIDRWDTLGTEVFDVPLQ